MLAQAFAAHVARVGPMLTRALCAAGNRGEALAGVDTCQRRLADELGAMPSALTAAFFVEPLAADHRFLLEEDLAGRPQ